MNFGKETIGYLFVGFEVGNKKEESNLYIYDINMD